MCVRELPELEVVRLGSGDEIPRILIGCWQLADDHRLATRLPDAAVDDRLGALVRAGLGTFDMADIYTGVEARLGRFRRQWVTAGNETSRLRIHTKLVPDRDGLGRFRTPDVEGIVGRSRERLGVGQLDLVQLHWWDFAIPGWLKVAQTLTELRSRDWLRQLGVTNFDATHLESLLDIGIPVVSNQVQYSLIDRRPAARLAPLCQRHGIGLLAYGTLAGGFLSERWLGKPDPGIEVDNRSLVKYRLILEECGGWDAFQTLLESLASIADKHQASIANVAIRWVLDQPQVAAVIVGISDLERTLEHLRAFAIRLDDQDRHELDIAAGAGPEGEVYALERAPRSRHASIMRTNLNRTNG